MYTHARICCILTALILSTLLLPPATSAVVEPVSIQSGQSEGMATLTSPAIAQSREAAKALAREAYGQLPLYFIPNQGQQDERVAYYTQSSGHSIYFTAEEAVMALDETTLRMRFGEGKATQPVGVEKTVARVNYFIGNDPAKWRTDIPTYGELVYHDLYPGIDLRYAGQMGVLKYTFVVQPGADPAQIRLAFEGVAGLRLDEEGNLLILAGGNKMKDTKPYAYQEIGGRRVEVETEFTLYGVRDYGFAVRGDYDSRYPLIIDPTLVYSTYLGGSGIDFGYGIAVDEDGHAYVTGYTQSANFPTKNPFDSSLGGSSDVFVTKIDTTQSGAASLVYSTYLGGGGDEGYNPGHCRGAIAVDGAGNAYVTGQTKSTDFPTQNAYQVTYGGGGASGGDAFVAKLNAAGSTLLYSTYLGGSDDDEGRGIAVDGAGNAYVTGSTPSTNFPTQNPYQGDQPGHDVFVTKIDTTQSGAASLIYSTYLGGSWGDYGNKIAVDGNGNAYVTGWTVSTDFPTTNAYQGAYGGGDWDAFVTKLNAAGGSLLYSTYLGGSDDDRGYGIAVDGAGNAYVAGRILSTDFPTTTTAYQGVCGSCPTSHDASATKIDTTQSGNASLIYSTYLGGSDGEAGEGIAVDGDGNAYVVGVTPSTDFPTQNPYQGTYAGGRDAFVTRLNADGSALLYSTYLGGTGEEEGTSIAVDGAGNAYVTGYVSSMNFPTRNPYQGTNGGGGYHDAFVTKLGVLAIGKSAFPDLVTPGGLITYTIVVSETGGVDATGVQVTDTVPADTTCCASIGQGGALVGDDVTWSGLAISGGQAISLTFVVTVGQVPSGTIITNDTYRVVTSTLGANTGLGSAVTTTVALPPIYLPIILKSY
jgi:uncharacterized repeat protein (TIGR01451 family)